MNSKIIWEVFGVLISIACCIVTGTQTFGPEPIDKLPLYTNISDLIVYGKTFETDTKWVDDNILTLNEVKIYDILKLNSTLNFTIGSSVPIYVERGRVNDPIQAAAHNGVYRSEADWELGIKSNTTLVYFLMKNNNGMYHLVYVETVDPNSEYSRSNLTELKTLIGEIMKGLPVPERTYKHE
ncbi:hypothetical protein [Methanospirillum lacunae]|uniref:Uncharacterized protein n=1 Tax=Methanospirillum lacunae TaxID=668570 RepID=A0A2V2MXF3_9EURY|nr:hypothetical protein [Methanospirillum lacunae]PWR72592.1 hypothetical protein DK846_06395 [Methanospirillum lacunae]